MGEATLQLEHLSVAEGGTAALLSGGALSLSALTCKGREEQLSGGEEKRGKTGEGSVEGRNDKAKERSEGEEA